MIKHTKAYIIFFLFIGVLISETFGQSGSAYTRIGIGDIEYSYSARKLGIGQLGVSVSNNDLISIMNPAGLNRLTRTRIETGLNYSGLFLKSGNASTYYGEVEFSGFSFGFPISSDYGVGAALGILPYSNVSYEVLENIAPTAENEAYNILYEGRGGLSKMFLAASYTLPFNLTIGASLDYYFGNLNYFSKTEFLNTQTLNAEYKRTYSPRGLGSTLGIITPDIAGILNFENISDFRFGVVVSLAGELTTDTSFTSTSSLGIDTIAKGKSYINIPLRIAAGFSFILNKNFLFTFDYVYQGWSEYEMEGKKSSNLRDAMKLSGGFEFRPERELGASLWEQIIWRAGLSYEQTQYIIYGEGIDQLSVSGGFSFPLSLENTMDIGLQYAMRGTSDSNLYDENIIRLGVGLSLGEIWFVRQEK
ncbi:MAG: hypothetical protein R6W90_12450 [Ignavibacteriaceae bacterium]